MKEQSECLACTFEEVEQYGSCARVVVHSSLVGTLYKHALDRHRECVQAQGFVRGTTPISYIERTYRSHIVEHMKEFLLNHCIISFLCDELHRKGALFVGDPRLVDIQLEPSGGAEFVFSLPTAVFTKKSEWRKVSFRPPMRRNYKDIDRQVEDFVREELSLAAQYKPATGISRLDWVLLSVNIADRVTLQPLLEQNTRVWMKIGKEDADREAHELLLGKKVGDSCVTDFPFLQNFFSKRLDTDYTFVVTVLAIVPHAFFSFDRLLGHFDLTQSAPGVARDGAIHKKLIEVFSMRNDISLRRETIEALFKVLFKQFPMRIPREQVDRQKLYVFEAVQKTPDYPVYRLQKDFKDRVTQLAEKQLREFLIIDHLAYEEAIKIGHEDIVNYMSLFNRPRTKEFIYFHLPPTQISGQEQPIHEGIVNQAVLREKTLNHLIALLAKRL